MLRKFMKASLSMVLAFSLILLPNSLVLSKTIVSYDQIQTNEKLLTSSVNTYDEAQKLAEKKAKLLTSIYGVTSIQYALVDNGSIVVSGQSGVYSKETSIPPTESNMYGIGSISKLFTTVAVMQLVEQGKVNLDTPVTEYIPDFTMKDSRYKEITVRMLLNHSSGLMGSTLSSSILYDDIDFNTYHDLLNTLKDSRLKANPGEFSVYCNDGFTLAEILIEKVTGMTFSQYIYDNVSKPLSLENTKTPLDEFPEDQLVKTYLPGQNNALPNESFNMIGAGGIYSTASDLCNLATLFMNNSTSTVLSRSSSIAMMNSEYLNGIWPDEEYSSLSYGLGWDSVDTYPLSEYNIKALSKGGDTLLYHSNIMVLPEENMAIAILSSGGASTYNQIMAQEILLAALKSKGTIPEIKPDKTFEKPVLATMPLTQKEFEGFYAFYGGIIKIAISDDGILSLSNASEPNVGIQTYQYTGDGRFYYSDGSTYLTFVKESNDNTYLFCEGFALLPSIGQTVSAGYQAQKLEENTISEDLKNTWATRSNKNYFIVTEKYSSQIYASGSPSISISLPIALDGYFINGEIIDKYNANVDLQIPGMYGRDLSDYKFFKLGNVDYLKAGRNIYISEDGIKPLPTKAKFTSKISVFEHAKWYKIGDESANKTIQITIPEHASFTVYDENKQLVTNSYINGNTEVTLPLNGYIVFAGNAKAKFTIKYIDSSK
jgi:CubicO group peptidase (beta-lactamase class C family)